MYYYAIAFVCEYLCIPYLNEKALWVAQLAPIIYLLQAIVFWLLWFGGVFTIRFVGSPTFLLILSGQAKHFCIPFKGTSNSPHSPKNQKTPKNIVNLKKKKLRRKEKRKWPCINDSKFKTAQQQTILISETLLDRIIFVTEMRCKINSSSHVQIWSVGYWAIQRSWFSRVNALCNLSRKKSQEVAAHFRADFWVGVASRCV